MEPTQAKPVKKRRRWLIVAFVLALVSVSSWLYWPQAIASSRIAVDKTALTFDPETCTEGKAGFFWALGSCAVKVLGHEGDQCVFEYTQEIEMGTSVYLVKVPINSGPVTVRIDRVTQGTSTYDWPVTSFPLDQAKMLRQANARGILSN